MQGLASALSALHSPHASPEQINSANAVLVAFRERRDASAQCLALLTEKPPPSPALLHFAVGTLSDSLESCPASPSVLFKAALDVFALAPPPPLLLALHRLLGRLAALRLLVDWPLALSDLLAAPPRLGLGSLGQMADAVAALLTGKAAAQTTTRMQEKAAAVCAAVDGSLESLRLLEAWLRAGAVPVTVLVPSGLVQKTVGALANPALFESAVLVLGEMFAAPVVGTFRTARSVVRTSLSIDVPAQRALVMQVVVELMRMNNFKSNSLVMLLCEILRQHPTLVVAPSEKQQMLIEFLFACLGSRMTMQHALPVWIRLEESIVSEAWPVWKAAFSKVLMLVLKSAHANPEDDEWRQQLEETILSCANVIGVEAFFNGLESVPLEVSLWAASAARVLHDGRSPYCLPRLFESAMQVPQPMPLVLVRSACAAFSGYRTFLREFAEGRLIVPVAQFISKSLQMAPTNVSRTLLDLSEVCDLQLSSNLVAITPMVLAALQHFDEATAVMMLSMVAELISNLEDARADSVTAEVLDCVLGLGAGASSPLSETSVVACAAFCERLAGKSSKVCGLRLARAWPQLAQLVRGSDEACELVTQLAIAAGLSAQNMFPAMAAELSAVLAHRPSPAAVNFLVAFVTLGEAPEPLLAAFVESCRRCCQLVSSNLKAHADLLTALFNVAKRTQWNREWRVALATFSPVYQGFLQLIPGCLAHLGSNFKLLEETSAFETALFQYADAALVNSQIRPVAAALVSAHLSSCLLGNPMAMRFSSGPLNDLLRLMPAQAAAALLAPNLASILAQFDSRVAQAATSKALDSLGQSGVNFKALMVDLQLLVSGRGDDSFLRG